MNGGYEPPPGSGGGGGLPSVVAFVAETGITGDRTYNNLPSAPTDDGLYVLDAYWLATTLDPSTFYDFTVNWTDQNGAQMADITGTQSTQYSTPIANLNPVIMHPAIGTSIEGVWTVTPTGVLTVAVTGGNAGLLYAPGDTGFITQGGSSNDAKYTVLTVDGGGGVLTASIAAKGRGFVIANGNATSVFTGNGDGNLQLDITALAPPAAVFAYYATLTRLH